MDLARLGIVVDPTGAKVGLAQVDRSLAKTELRGKRAAANIGGSFNKLKGTFAGVGGMIAGMGAFVGIAAIYKTLSGFEQSMSSVLAVTQATSREMELLEARARSLGATTRYTAGEAADAMKFLGMAGFSTSKILGSVNDMLNLATAGNLELARAADIASNIMTAFGMQAHESARMADLLATAASSTNTNVEQLGDAMKYAGPVAAGFGYSLENTAAAMGVLSNAGLQASMAGTGLRKVLSELMAPSGAATGILKRLSVDVADLDPRVHSLSKAFTTLSEAGFTAQDAMEMFGLRGGPAAIAFLQYATTDLKRFEEAFLDSAGRAKEMADIMEDNIPGAAKKALSAIQELILSLSGSTGLSDAIKGTLGAFTDLFRYLATLGEGELAGPLRRLEAHLSVLDAAQRKMASLMDTYASLSRQEQLTASDQERLNRVVGELYKEMPEFTSKFDEHGDALKGSKETIQSLVDRYGDLRSRMEEIKQVVFGTRLAQGEEELLAVTEKRRDVLAQIEKMKFIEYDMTLSNPDDLDFLNQMAKDIKKVELEERTLFFSEQVLRQELKSLTEEFDRNGYVMIGLSKTVSEHTDEVEDNEKALRSWQKTIDSLHGDIKLANRELEFLQETTLGEAEAAQELARILEIEKLALKTGAGEVGRKRQQLEMLVDVYYELQEQIEETNFWIDKGREVEGRYLTQQEKISDQLQVIQTLRDKDRISVETYTRAMGELREELAAVNLQTALEEGIWQAGVSSAAQRYMRQAGNVAKGIEDAFTMAFRNIEDVMTEFFITGKADWESFLRAIQADITRYVVLRPLISRGVEAMGLAAVSFGKGGVMGTDGPMLLRSYAQGGISPDDQLAKIHKGEAVVPLPDGRSIPVIQKGGETQTIVHATINLQGVTDARSFRQNEDQIIRQLNKRLSAVKVGS